MSRFNNLPYLKTLHKNVTSAGTAEVLNANFIIADGITVTIKAKSANAGDVFIGGSKSDAQSSSVRFTLQANEALALQMENLNALWLDAANSADGVEISFETQVAP